MLPLYEEIKKTPVVFIVIPFILGIIFQENNPLEFWVFISTALVVFTIFYALFSSRLSIPVVPYLLFLILASSFSIGAFTTQITQQKEKPDAFVLASDAYIATIQDIPYLKNNKVHALLKIEYIKSNQKWKKTGLLCQATFADSARENYKTAQKFYIRAKLKKPQPPAFPGQFDYSKYLYYKGIYLQSYIQANEIRPITSESNTFLLAINSLREEILHNINNGSLGPREESIISAFILGFTKNMDPELNQAYTNAGASHILSVSGMHVGLVFLYLTVLLKSLNRSRKLKVLKSIIIISLLWFYAALAGLSSPVLRATFMFSFFALADISTRKISPINILACSALILLIINPYLLFDVGFQLSYAAMLGIFLIYLPLSDRWMPQNKIIRNIYSMMLLSVAAQMMTLPFILYYFQQFPTYFLLANLVIIPISGIVLYIAILYSLFLPISFIAHLLMYPLKYSILLLNTLVLQVEELPGKIIQNSELDFFHIFLISIAILCILFLVVRKNVYAFPAFIVVVLILISYVQLQNSNLSNYTYAKIFKINNHAVLSVKQGNVNLIIGTTETLKKISIKNSRYIDIEQNQIHFKKKDIQLIKKDDSRLFIATPQAFIVLILKHTSGRSVQKMIILKRNHKIIGIEDLKNNTLKEFKIGFEPS